MYLWFYCKIPPHFGGDNVKFYYMDTDSFVFSFSPIEGLINDFQEVNKDSDLSEIDPTHEL